MQSAYLIQQPNKPMQCVWNNPLIRMPINTVTASAYGDFNQFAEMTGARTNCKKPQEVKACIINNVDASILIPLGFILAKKSQPLPWTIYKIIMISNTDTV